MKRRGIGVLSRRSVLVGASASVGLVLVANAQGVSTAPAAAMMPVDLWLRISPRGAVTVRTISCDMGQGAQTGIAQIVCEELDADWTKVAVEMAPVEERFFIRNAGYYTGGSQSISRWFDRFREIGASARSMLIEAAAKRWRVDAASCSTEVGRVVHTASGRQASYGDLAVEASKVPQPTQVALKPRERWRVIGQSLRRLDLDSKVAGKAIYGVDVVVPNMLVGAITRCPVIGGKLVSVDPTPAKRITGVDDVVALDDAIVVVADSFWSAQRGIEALGAVWDLGFNASVDTATIFKRLRDGVGAADSEIYAPEGTDAAALRRKSDDAFEEASRIVEATYEAPFLAHTPIEPMNATARVDASGCDVWLPTQDQGDARAEVAKALAVEPAKVRVHTTALGGGFGRRLRVEYAVYAARAAKAVGRPVKLIWSRPEDTRQSFYRPATVMRLRAALTPDATIAGLETFGATNNDTAFGGVALVPYAIPSVIAGQKKVETHIPYGPWRAVDRSQNVFYMESFIDEIAHALKKDPLALRRSLLAASPRHTRVLNTAAELAAWGKPPPGRHQGLAFMSGWGTSVAQVAEISVSPSRALRVHKIYCAFDCGTAVNPGIVKAQIEGGILMGLSAALAEEITVREGRVEQGFFDSYPVLRMGQAPEIEIHLLESPGEPVGGVGEPPLPPVAPALANAIFAATGQRLRSLPVVRHGFAVS
jgi:isoquinoline 1-oxidoreductase beta subunit